MFKNWSIVKKLIFGFLILIVIVGIVSAWTLFCCYKTKIDANDIKETMKKERCLIEIKDEGIAEIRDNMLKIFLTENINKKREYYNRILEAKEKFKKALKILKISHKFSPEEEKAINKLINNMINLEKFYNKAIEFSMGGNNKKALAIYQKEILPKMEAIHRLIDEKLETPYYRFFYNKIIKIENDLKKQIIILLICGALFISISILVIYTVVLSIKRPVQKLENILERIKEGDLNAEIDIDSKDEIGLIAIAIKGTIEKLKHVISDVRNVSRDIVNFSGKLSGITNEFSNNLNMQAEKATQIASSAEEMSITIVDIAKNTNNILENSKNTAEVSKKGEEMTLKTAEEIKTIEQAAEKLQSIMGNLEERSKAIENVLTFIKDVAEQTNLLALNATIEAARAGEHGKSFAVVAGEIRKLAERTNKSTDEIGQMIKEIQVVVGDVKGAVDDINKKVASGVKLSEETSEILKEITKQSESLQERIQSIASATEEMSTVADQVSQDINSVAQASREMTQGVEEVIKTVENMSNLSIKLNKSIEFFKMDKDINGEKCPNLERCPFFGDRLENMPATAELLKSEYCLGEGKNYKECARYIVASTLGKEFVPPDLFPHQKERALEIIKANKK
ncbi:methyl-accepting chemotaxis protein [Thermodesulfobacterium hydrogeniphilum]|uniref:methyl-accepting chemotaxis protein n=1 Tax=Thermodesulfobacterium hydrogeniphilum TaxID=161156 RepID=UPI0005705361|nr:methyl-accepting chemotaxis protein [Thermodesulfobacterium hydrogeniphilum]